MLGTPPAFILSQDQTLSMIPSVSFDTYLGYLLTVYSRFERQLHFGFRSFFYCFSGSFFFRIFPPLPRLLASFGVSLLGNLRGPCINPSLFSFHAALCLSLRQPFKSTSWKTLCQALFYFILFTVFRFEQLIDINTKLSFRQALFNFIFNNFLPRFFLPQYPDF